MTYIHAVKCLWRLVLRRLQWWMKEMGGPGGRRAYIMSNCLDEIKAAQIAARFLSKAGGRMRRLPFVKYMYMADRMALERWGYPLTWDSLFSLPDGPIQSCILNLAQQKQKTYDGSYCWRKHIKVEYTRSWWGKPIPWNVLISEPEENCLPPAVIDLIDEIYETYKDKDIVSIVHEVKEFTDPGRGRIRISYADVLREVGRPDGAEERSRELESYARARALINC